ncbi:MAG: KH domain-containing protein [Bradymonadaceae bacterium]|nr:KH domain-containing protein [Lujinxingiaceae bacterium]
MATPETEAMEQHIELVRYLANSLLSEDVDFGVAAKVSGDQIRIDLSVPEGHRGRVIGRGGRLARALRTIVSAAGISTNKNIVLDIVD